MEHITRTVCILATVTTCLGAGSAAPASELAVVPAQSAGEARDLSGDWQFVQFWRADGALARIEGTARIDRRPDGEYDFRYAWTKGGRDDSSAWRGSVRGGVLWGVHVEKPEAAFVLGQATPEGCLLGVVFHSARGASVSGIGLCRPPAKTDEAVLQAWNFERGTGVLAQLANWLGPDLPPAFERAWGAWKKASGSAPSIAAGAPVPVGRIPARPAPPPPAEVLDPIPNVLDHPLPVGWGGHLTCPAGTAQRAVEEEIGCLRPDGTKDGPWVRVKGDRVKCLTRWVAGEEQEVSCWDLRGQGPSEYVRYSGGQVVQRRNWRNGVLRKECDPGRPHVVVCTEFRQDGTREDYSERCFDVSLVERRWREDGTLSADRQATVDCEALALIQVLGRKVFDALRSGRPGTVAEYLPSARDLPDLASMGMAPAGSALAGRVKSGEVGKELQRELREVREQAAKDGVDWSSIRYHSTRTTTHQDGPLSFHQAMVVMTDGTRLWNVRVETVVRAKRGLLVFKGFDWVK